MQNIIVKRSARKKLYNMLNRQDIEFIRQSFGGQTDKSGILQWQHGIRAAEILEEFFDKYGEVSADKKDDLLRGALGHDLLEDTNIGAAEIERQLGKKALLYIREMTNEKGDDAFREYVSHLQKADEETLLIKFADILANTGNFLNHIAAFSREWVADFWLPLLKNYETALLNRSFNKYPHTLNDMAGEIKKNIRKIEEARK